MEEYSIREESKTKGDNWTECFVLTETDLERLCNALQPLVSSIDLIAECRDGKIREFSSLHALWKFENPPNKEITGFWLKASLETPPLNLVVGFDSRLPAYTEGNIFLHLEGQDENVSAVREIIQEHLTGMKPWYHVIAGFNFTKMVLLVVGMLLWFLIPYGLENALDKGLGIIERTVARIPGAVNLPSQGIINAVGFFLFLGMPIPFIMLAAKILNSMRERIFPTGVIALSQGAKRHGHKEIVRTVVVIAFFVSLVASLVAALVLRQES